MQTLSQLG